jgi:hypothetical protein
MARGSHKGFAMQNNNNDTEFKTIGNHELATAIGGDHGSSWFGNLKKDWKELGQRSAGLRSSVKKGDVVGALKNGVAGGVDGLSFIGDAVSPVAGIIGAKP